MGKTKNKRKSEVEKHIVNVKKSVDITREARITEKNSLSIILDNKQTQLNDFMENQKEFKETINKKSRNCEGTKFTQNEEQTYGNRIEEIKNQSCQYKGGNEGRDQKTSSRFKSRLNNWYN